MKFKNKKTSNTVRLFYIRKCLKRNVIKKSYTTCCKVCDADICPNCKSKKIIKNGFTKNRKQQFYCKSCKTRSIDFYSNKAFFKNINSRSVKTKHNIPL